MQKVQIYVGSERLELFKDETVSITQSIQNIKDISKIFTEFTQSFTIPASPTNNKIFTHYYNYNIVGGFDARQKVSSSIELNYLPWKNGFIALNGVDLKNNKPHSYRITFYGETVNLKDIIGEDMLSSLVPLSNENLVYQSDYTNGTDGVKEKLQADPTNTNTKIIAPLITHTSRLTFDSTSTETTGKNLSYDSNYPERGVLWSDLKYAIRVDTIVQAIQSYYTTANQFASNIVFSNDFFNTSNANYYNLFMWLHRKKGSVDAPTQVTQYSSLVNTWTPNSTSNFARMLNSSTLALYDDATTYNNLIITVNTVSLSEQYQVIIHNNQSVFYESSFASGDRTFNQTDMGLMTGGVSQFYTVTIVQKGSNAITIDDVEWQVAGVANPQSLNPITWSSTFTSAQFITSTAFDFIIQEQIPEMKVIDLLTGLFKMFNLTAYVENGIIVVKTLDEYYQLESTWNTTNTLWQNDDRLWNEAGTSGASIYSLDEFVDVNSTQVNVALPFKQVNFEYEGLGTFLAEQYNQLNNIGWGTERYTLDSETYDAPNEVYKVQVPFEHLQMERLVNVNGGGQTPIQYGYFVDQNQQAYFGKPLLFYPILQTTTAGLEKSISFRDTSSTHLELTSYIIPSNSVALSSGTDTSNINFSLEINEYQLDGSFTGTLFATYYENYIAEIFNTKRRMFKVTAYLPLNLIYNLKLYDTIEINYENYRINSMTTDLTNGKSSIELINLV
jgi:hypothetical protein